MGIVLERIILNPLVIKIYADCLCKSLEECYEIFVFFITIFLNQWFCLIRLYRILNCDVSFLFLFFALVNMLINVFKTKFLSIFLLLGYYLFNNIYDGILLWYHLFNNIYGDVFLLFLGHRLLLRNYCMSFHMIIVVVFRFVRWFFTVLTLIHLS